MLNRVAPRRSYAHCHCPPRPPVAVTSVRPTYFPLTLHCSVIPCPKGATAKPAAFALTLLEEDRDAATDEELASLLTELLALDETTAVDDDVATDEVEAEAAEAGAEAEAEETGSAATNLSGSAIVTEL